MRRLVAAAIVLAALLAPRMLEAQGGWSLELAAGRAVHDPLSARIGAVALAIAPGIYHYAFRTEEGLWFLPHSVTSRTDDGMGGTSAVLIVP